MSNYLNGHARVPHEVFVWMCQITHVSAQSILNNVTEQSVLLQSIKRPLRYQRHQKPKESQELPR